MNDTKMRGHLPAKRNNLSIYSNYGLRLEVFDKKQELGGNQCKTLYFLASNRERKRGGA